MFVPINENLHWSLVVFYRPGEYARVAEHSAEAVGEESAAERHLPAKKRKSIAQQDGNCGERDPPCKQPRLLYIDSMNEGSPIQSNRANDLLKSYMSLEFDDKRRKSSLSGSKRLHSAVGDIALNPQLL